MSEPAEKLRLVQAPPRAKASVDGKAPPHDPIAEACVVGAMILGEGSALTDELLAMVTPETLWDERHRAVVDAIGWLREKERPVDASAVLSRLADVGKDRAVGGMDGIVAMVNSVPTANEDNVRAFARRVLEMAELRKVLALCQRVEADIFAGRAGDVKAFKDVFEKDVFEICKDAAVGGPERMKEIAKRALVGYINGNQDEVIPTGFAQYDRLVRGGLRRTNYTLIAGATSMGKTAWCLNIAHRVAKAGVGVLFVSLEMTKYELFQRMMCSEADVSSSRLDEGFLGEELKSRIATASIEVGQLPIDVVDEPGQTIVSVRAHGRRTASAFAKDGKRLGLLIVDYLQLMKGTASRNDSREREVADISKSMKGLAKYLDCHVIGLSQLNDNASSRKGEDKRPKLGDLRESKAMAHDADIVTFVWREDYELERDARGRTIADVGNAEIIIAKQRSGRSGGAAKMTFDKGRQRFESAPDDEPPPSRWDGTR